MTLKTSSDLSPLGRRGPTDDVATMLLNCILDSAANLLVCHMEMFGNVQKSPGTSHPKGLDPSVEFNCQGPAPTGIKEG